MEKCFCITKAEAFSKFLLLYLDCTFCKCISRFTTLVKHLGNSTNLDVVPGLSTKWCSYFQVAIVLLVLTDLELFILWCLVNIMHFNILSAKCYSLECILPAKSKFHPKNCVNMELNDSITLGSCFKKLLCSNVQVIVYLA